jgi:acyl-CoA dehydrogenase
MRGTVKVRHYEHVAMAFEHMTVFTSEMRPRVKELWTQLKRFMEERVFPNESLYERQLAEGAHEFRVPPVFYDLQAEAKAEGLWNLFLPESEHGAGLTNFEYAPLCELMGWSEWSAGLFNCNAPDTGNIEVLVRYGSDIQKRKYLEPLLDGRTRSCYAMTEPDVASSDATNIRTRIERDGDSYVINGRKWFASNAFHPDLGFFIVMGKTNPDAPKHKQHGQIIVDPNTPGLTKVRHLPVLGYPELPRGHAELRFENVRVPAENIILGEGRGFEISQGRLGPGRVHHCMRIIGQSERLLEKTCKRLLSRVAFGKPLSDQGVWQERVAQARTEINMCRLLVLHAARKMDLEGNRAARNEISQIKVACAQMGGRVGDQAIQAFGAAGLTDDFGLGHAFARLRVLRIADGPDEVHNFAIARMEFAKYKEDSSS